MLRKVFVITLISSLFFASCRQESSHTQENTKEDQPPTESFRQLTIKVLREIPHGGDKRYTQGFEIYKGVLYESTGLENRSSLKKIDLASGELIQSKDLSGFFAEGLTIMNDYITLISYREKKAFSYNTEDFSEKNINFTYETEGWGLSNNGSQLIMSDGSDKIYFRSPFTFKIEKTIHVKLKGRPIYYVNELEYVNGKIYANVYGSRNIIVINENTGQVEAEINASSIFCSQISGSNPEAVLNGIAFNPETNTFFITGKECPYIFEVVFE
ncbi:glutaminyl-peptide cyclotransferase [Bacteroidota bacterium]